MSILAWKDAIPPERLLGFYSCGLPGPLLIAIGGIHGNEPNGPRAIKAFVNMLHTQSPLMTGAFVGLMGNVSASKQNQRYVDKDLNRCFVPGYITAGNEALLGTEAAELRELTTIIERVQHEFEDVCFVDCHTTSTQTIPYLSINVHSPSIQLANRFPLNSVIGLQQSIPGCFTEYANKLDFRGFTFEAGQHLSAAAFSNQVAMLWLLLVFSGALSKRDLPMFRHYEKMLGVETPANKRSFRLISHYRIKDGEEFRMRPGFRNFDFVDKGMHLADNRFGRVLAPDDGYVLMPLYQAKGQDGFFLLEEESARSLQTAALESY